ncbi:MAG: hypothetical protein UT32_C0047G0003 [Parcubacteria group bacterium GW2011_GWC2_39_14]|nr:MAG: hypothetical protein UT32_C0047G0003 [Parcubacteria group bacterium GW2011_GWC2_39_14]
MNKVYDILKSIGFTETETKIYLIGLGYSSLGVSELVKQTQIKRTTVYHALDTLMQKGLVAKKGIGSRMVFSMIKPEQIEKLVDEKIALLEKQKTALEEIVPFLTQKTSQKESQVRVSHFEGLEGIKMVVEEALYCKSRKWDIIAPGKNFFSEFDKQYAQYFLETRKKREIMARSLWEEVRARELNAIERASRNPKILPAIMRGKFQSVIILFDDKVAFISSLKELSAVLIQSQELHNTMAALFEGLWSISKDYPKNV